MELKCFRVQQIGNYSNEFGWEEILEEKTEEVSPENKFRNGHDYAVLENHHYGGSFRIDVIVSAPNEKEAITMVRNGCFSWEYYHSHRENFN